ncbi:hypothetical protein HHL22_16715 [Hymenobacter sp. RP-2-7]|uniref:DUF4177 domain-containing protein n=1 Tax=Hymenobacter polaris TaxID=2682546 RepID=A0A7Y0AGD3_9BACT|nr:hypothetical protein [Hymenobacter polaris]NML66850.1 hypothetical protein [Hymenobacter polaris]
MLPFSTCCRRALLGAALLLPLGALPAAAQGTFATTTFHQPPALEYLTLTFIESAKHEFAKMVLAPSFHATSETSLDAYDSFTEAGNSWAYQHNQERLAKQLDELATEGWEVFEVHAAPYLPASEAYSTRYLLRRPRR